MGVQCAFYVRHALPALEPLFLALRTDNDYGHLMAVAAQIDLITDDPRCEATQGIMADIREFVQASRECGGLLTMGQAAKILDVGANQVSVWVARGRIKSKVVLGVKMVSAGEVLAFYRERAANGTKPGPRGLSAPLLADLVSTAWEDIEPLK